MILLLTACAPQPEAPADGLTLLDPREQLIRVSVDLRGVHPSETELAAIEANPELYEQFVDRYLADERFLDRVEEVWNLKFLTRNGETYFDTDGIGLDGVPSTRIAASIADEPLKLVRHLVENDLPYSEVVTANYTMADEVLAAAYNLDYPDTGEGWQAAHYRDGRPEAGILSMTTTWLKYPSMGGNANRHRANAVSKLLLCDDYLSRPILLNRTNIDQLVEDPEVAILSETCQSCHASLDPLAAHFYGFFHEDPVEERDVAIAYFPENEEGWRDYADKSPAYYGTPTGNLTELGAQIADDPRFAECATKIAWEGFTQRTYTDADWSELQAAEAAFTDAGMLVKPLVREIVTSRAYLARQDDAGRVETVKTASPAQLANIIDGITGYRWTFDGQDGLVDPTNGLVILAGGVDGGFVTTPNYVPSVGSVFVLERLAQAAALDVAAHDLDPARTDAARMINLVSATDTPDGDPDRFEAQIRALYLQVTGLELASDATEPAELATLWKQIYSVEASSEKAWAGVLSVILRDPRILFY